MANIVKIRFEFINNSLCNYFLIMLGSIIN